MNAVSNKKQEEIYPSYLGLYQSGELSRRVKTAINQLSNCNLCPCNCGVDRTVSGDGICKTGRYAVVSGAFPHFGEEDCLRGKNGSGTIYFSNCNMQCVFCVNRENNSGLSSGGLNARPEIIAGMMLDLQAKGCHNVNFVTPEHVIPQILEALEFAVPKGFSLPIVYNSSSYNNPESLKLLDGIVDIYAADFKFWDQNLSEKYLKVKDYPEKAKISLKIMHEQVGDLVVDEKGIARKGLLVRHLIMPEHGDEIQRIADFLVSDISDMTYMNLLNQYHPAGDVSQNSFPELNRKLSFDEYNDVLETVKKCGITRIAEKRSIFSILDES